MSPSSLVVNGENERLQAESGVTLLDLLRERLDLTGSKLYLRVRDRAREAERALVGRPAGEAAYRAAAVAGAVPQRANAFKIELAKRTLVRALTEVAA